jgi:hypothetical protein
MRPRLLIAVLVLMLSGTNCDAASICAAYCMSSASAGRAAVHHHQMESRPGAANVPHHIHTRNQAAYCTECPPDLRNRLNQSADCAGLVQIQALREASFSFDAPSGVAHGDVARTPAAALALANNGEPVLLCDTSHRIRTPDPGPVPLRI